MFLRPLIELSEFVAEKAETDKVEVYYRCVFLDRVGEEALRKRGVRVFTRIRWQREDLEWTAGLGGFLPSLSALESLMRFVTPGKTGIPIPDGFLEEKFCVSSQQTKGGNVAGWFRDFLVTVSGIRLSAEGQFNLFEDENGLWNEKPQWTGLQNNGEHLVLAPQVILELLQAGLLKDIACRRRGKDLLHPAFEKIGGRAMDWFRTPDSLEPGSGAVGLSVPIGTGGDGQVCDRAVIGKNGQIEMFCENTKNWTLSRSMLKSMKKVSEEYLLYRNGVMFQLPWVELEGGTQWESP